MKKLFVFLSIYILGISNVFAEEEFTCEVISPNLQAMGEDRYYDFDAKPEITREIEKNIIAFYKAAVGKWSGKITEIECKGAGSNLRQEIDEGTVEVVISSIGKVLFNIYAKKRFENKRIKISRNDTYELFHDDHVFELTIERNTISASEKYRRKNEQGFTNLFEIISSLTLKDNELEIIIAYYINTVSVHQDKMILKKDR